MTNDTQFVICPTTGTVNEQRYHNSLTCPSIEKMNDPRVKPLEDVDDRRKPCAKCAGQRLPGGFEIHDEPDGCPSCGARLNENRECVYCRRFDHVHEHPRNEAIP